MRKARDPNQRPIQSDVDVADYPETHDSFAEIPKKQANAVEEIPEGSNAADWEPYVVLAYGIKPGSFKALVPKGSEIYKGQNIFHGGVLGQPMGHWDPETSEADCRRHTEGVLPNLHRTRYICAMLSKYTTPHMRSPWRLLLGVLCISLIFSGQYVTDGIALKVKQDFAAKEKAKKDAKPKPSGAEMVDDSTPVGFTLAYREQSMWMGRRRFVR